jgi:hypothetical protein
MDRVEEVGFMGGEGLPKAETKGKKELVISKLLSL